MYNKENFSNCHPGKDKSRSKSSSKQHLSKDEDFPSAAHKAGSAQSISMHQSQTFPTNVNKGSSHQGYPPRTRPGSEHSVAIMSDTQYPEVPQTYTDFRRDLQSRSQVLPVARDTDHMITRRPNSYHQQGYRRSQGGSRSKGYESDAGYRSEGVQSEIVYTRRNKPPGGSGVGASRDGYASDWEATNRQRQAYKSRPVNQLLGPHHYHAQQQRTYYHHPPHNNSAYTATSHSKVPPTSLLGQPVAPSTAYIPSTNRTTLRNDELYEPQKNKSRNSSKNHQSNGKVKASGNNSSQVHSHVEPMDKEDSGTVMASGKNVVEKDGATGSERISQEGRNEEEVNEDDAWRAQLYQASVKLQKSPSDPNKQVSTKG